MFVGGFWESVIRGFLVVFDWIVFSVKCNVDVNSWCVSSRVTCWGCDIMLY